jgi:hypothetical protein
MYEYLLLGLLGLTVRYVRGYEQLVNYDPFGTLPQRLICLGQIPCFLPNSTFVSCWKV